MTSSFLIGTAFLTVTCLPIYFWFFDLDWFQAGMFFTLIALTGFSITAVPLPKKSPPPSKR